MRKKIIAGNWKMNNTLEQGLSLSSKIATLMNSSLNKETIVILGTPFIHLSPISKLALNTTNLYVAAQDCSIHESGAYTGEISASMIHSTGATHIIIGHSERREYHHETYSELAIKVDLSLKLGLTPIFCCGESLAIRKSEEHEDFVCNQLSKSLFHLSEHQIKNLIIAYEPIWAIGTGLTASPTEAQSMHKVIRMHLMSRFGDIAENISILYGGSCKPDSAKKLFSEPDIDGGLIGGASLNPNDFISIIQSL